MDIYENNFRVHRVWAVVVTIVALAIGGGFLRGCTLHNETVRHMAEHGYEQGTVQGSDYIVWVKADSLR